MVLPNKYATLPLLITFCACFHCLGCSLTSVLNSGIFKKLLLFTFIGILAWAYQAFQPPQPKIPGSPGGPPITALRIKLRDGRHLAYKEHGIPKDAAKYKIITVHGFGGCRHQTLSLSQVDDRFSL